MTSTGFCPRCGEPRVGNFRWCRQCRFDFDELPAPSAAVELPAQASSVGVSLPAPSPAARAPATPAAAPQPTVTSDPRTTAVLAGVAWIVAALLTAYVALAQYNLSQTLTSLGTSDEGLAGTALWNGIAAAVTLYFGAKMLTTPTRQQVTRSIWWSLLNVVLGGLQIVGGATYEPFVLAIIAAATAGVLSYVARQGMPVEQATTVEGEVPTRPTSNSIFAPSRSRELAVVMVVGLVAVVVVVLIYQSLQNDVNGILEEVGRQVLVPVGVVV